MPAVALRPRFRGLPLLALPILALLAAIGGPAEAEAAIPWTPCPTAGYECAAVAVTLDRTNVVPGAISLAVTRVPVAANPRREAVLALAGGPGQAAVSLAPEFAAALKPAIADRDLLVYDQRGTGSSGPLSCAALQARTTVLQASSRCAAELGAARGSYRTADSVEDIEALRIAGGYDKLVLFGVSYGTKVALAYAAAHPAQVAALVLDSVVLPEGPDPYQRSTLTASARVLTDLCAGDVCSRATKDPARDLATTAARLRRGSLRGKVVTSSGRRTSYSMNQTGLLDILLAGDLNPTLRAELPGSLRAALTGDPAPLLRLSIRSEGLTTGLQSAAGGDSDALFLATTCEELPFGWTRAAGAAQRAAEASALAARIPKAQLGPFSPRAALQGGPIPFCLGWANASPDPAPPGPLPQVPTLVLNGQLDVRTPWEDAAQIPERIPGAVAIEVPNTGHSVLSADASTCSADALSAFFAGAPPPACAPAVNPYAPTSRPPRRLNDIRANGRTRRTLIAVTATVTDARRQIIGDAFALGRAPARVGGLRGGNAVVNSGTYRLRSYQYVTDVKVSGTADVDGSARVTVSGGGALRGSLEISATGAISGRLGGRKVTIGAASGLVDRLPSLKSVLAAPRLAR